MFFSFCSFSGDEDAQVAGSAVAAALAREKRLSQIAAVFARAGGGHRKWIAANVIRGSETGDFNTARHSGPRGRFSPCSDGSLARWLDARAPYLSFSFSFLCVCTVFA